MQWPTGLREKSARDKLATEICAEIESAKQARSGLSERWKVNEKMYRNQPGASGMQIIDGVEPYHIPLTKPKLDRVNGVVHHAITGIEPYLQVSTVSDDARLAADMAEQDIHFMLRKANFEKYLWEALQITSMCGVGILRISYVDGIGFQFRVVHPEDSYVYPSSAETIDGAKTVATRYRLMLSECERKQKNKAWDPKAKLTGGSNPDDDPAGRDPNFDKIDSSGFNQVSDSLVDLRDVLTFRSFGNDDPQWWRAQICFDTRQLLSIETFGASVATEYGEDYVPYSTPWLFGLKYHEEYGKFWPSTSLAQDLQGLQNAYSDGFNIMWGGSWASAFPTVFISGGSFPEDVKKIHPGDILVNPSPIAAQVVGTQFNPGTIPEMIAWLDRIADSVVRISQLGTGRQLKSETTATETNFLAEMQRQAEDQYTTYISIGLGDLFRFAFELYRIHHQDILSTFGPDIMLQDVTMLDGNSFLIEVNGKATTNSPTALIQKLQFLMQIAMSVPGIGLDPRKIAERLAQSLGLPFDVKKLAADQQPMGGVPGQPAVPMDGQVPGGAEADLFGLLGALTPGAGPAPTGAG